MRVIKWPRSDSDGTCVNKNVRGNKGIYTIFFPAGEYPLPPDSDSILVLDAIEMQEKPLSDWDHTSIKDRSPYKNRVTARGVGLSVNHGHGFKGFHFKKDSTRYISISFDQRFNTFENMTFEFWVQMSIGAHQYLLRRFGPTSTLDALSFVSVTQPCTLKFRYLVNNKHTYVATPFMWTRDPHYVVIIKSTNGMQVYVDGALLAQNEDGSRITPVDKPMVVGKGRMDGMLYSLRISTIARKPAEITHSFIAGRS